MSDEKRQMNEALSVLACSTDGVVRARALANLMTMLGRVEVSSKQAEWDGVARVGRGEPARVMTNDEFVRQQTEAQRGAGGALPLTTVLDCLWGVLNDATNGSLLAKPDAYAFYTSACVRLKSMPGDMSKGRTLTEDDLDQLARQCRWEYERCTRGTHDSYRAMLLWLEEKDYLSVRLPPQNQS